MKLGIEGKRALVAEGDGEIGQSITRTLAGEGAHMVIHGRDKKKAEHTAAAIIGDGSSAETIAIDLSTPEEGGAQVVATVFGRGGIEITVNIACMKDAGWSDWLSLPDEQWERFFLSNVMSAVRMTRAFVPVMRENGWGRIINVSNANAMTPSSTIADYQASGAAALLASRLADHTTGTNLHIGAGEPSFLH